MSRVVFRKDEDCEMLELYVDGKLWRSGNYWDFNFENDVPDLFDKLGIQHHTEEYSYEDEEE